jgi:hypothetical protein
MQAQAKYHDLDHDISLNRKERGCALFSYFLIPAS